VWFPNSSRSSFNRYTSFQGWGVCFIHRDTISVKFNPLQLIVHYISFENQLLTASITAKRDGTVNIVNIYRPPDTSMSSFLCDFSDLLARLGNDIENDRVVFCGDFNCVGASSNTMDADLQSLFDLNGMTHQVTSPTRQLSKSTSTLLDLIVCRSRSGRVSSVRISSSHISDHDLVTWSIELITKYARSKVSYKFSKSKEY